MRIPISFEQVNLRYPEQVKEVIVKLRKGKSKHRLEEAANLSWFFHLILEIKTQTIQEVIDEVTHPESEPTIDERMTEFARNCHVFLVAYIGHWTGYSKEISVPDEILSRQRISYQKDEEELKRFEVLPKEDQDKEIEADLQQLRKLPGFMEFRLT